MAKRTRLTSEDLVFPWCKRTKSSNHGSGDEIFEENPPSQAEGHLIGRNDRSVPNTEDLTPVISQQQENKESAGAEPKEPGTPIPEADDDKENNNDIQSPVTQRPSPLTSQQNANSHVSRDIQTQPPTIRRKLQTPKSETNFERPITKKQKKPKKSKTQPEFKIFEDETATRDNITEIEDENYSSAMKEVYSFVDAWIQKEGFEYGQKVVQWLVPLARAVDEATAGETGTDFYTQILAWSRVRFRRLWEILKVDTKSTEEWFGAEDVEALAELVEGIFSAVQAEGNAELKKYMKDFKKGGKPGKALIVCGFCRNYGFGPYMTKEPEVYVRLGNAWKRIFDHHFVKGRVWDWSRELVEESLWDEKMVTIILESQGWIQNVEILKTRWATSFPSATDRNPLQGLGQELNHSTEGYAWAQEDFDNGLD